MMYGEDEDTFGNTDVESGIPIPHVQIADPRGGFNNVPDCDYAGFGTGGETLHADGRVTTRWKSQEGGRGADGGAVSGGTP